MSMYFFQSLTDCVPDGVDISLTIRKSDGIITVAIVPKGNSDGNKLRPLIIRGTAEELDQMFLAALSEMQEPLEDLVYMSDLKKYSKEIKKETKAISKKVNTPSKTDRLKGDLNEEDKKWLIATSCTDIKFKSALKRASFETLKTAWDDAGESQKKIIGAEIQSLTGKPLEDSVAIEKQQTLF